MDDLLASDYIHSLKIKKIERISVNIVHYFENECCNIGFGYHIKYKHVFDLLYNNTKYKNNHTQFY